MGMTLSRKMSIQLTALVGAVVVLAGVSLWGVRGLEGQLASAVDEYQRLRAVYEAALPIASAAEALRGDHPDHVRARTQLQRASQRLRRLIQDDPQTSQPAQAALDQLSRVIDQLFTDDESSTQALAGVRLALNHMATQAANTRAGIDRAETAAAAQVQQTFTYIVAVGSVILLAAVCIGIVQYRSVMRPLHRMIPAVRRIAAGTFDQRLDAERTDEFAMLVEEINRMSAQLSELYRDLEAKVERASRELVRSERLASVGFLAAGVAHEINNPLGIIAGHAELTLSALREKLDEATVNESRESLSIITEEAFRCKGIIEKLLSLSRGSDAGKSTVSMRSVVDDVITMTQALPAYRNRSVVADLSEHTLTVHANDAEMKQVLLNLVVNALQATDDNGHVTITGKQDHDTVCIEVTDNGKGMDPTTLSRVFEPFFTTRSGAGTSGTGLGLSISHAIIESHGGTLRATSAGPNRGSTFTIILPALEGDPHG